MKNLIPLFFVLLFVFLSLSCSKENPEAFFTFKNNNCVAPCEVEFKDQSQNATTIRWDFGDGNTDQGVSNPKRLYSQPGEYTVTLVAINPQGSSTHKEMVKILAPAPPVADFTFTNNNCTAPCTVVFTSSIQNASSQQWDFGDSSPVSSEANPSHLYDAPGHYTVKLTAVGLGGSVTASKTVVIADPNQPQAIFTVENNNCAAPCEVSFKNTSLNASQYAWNFGDGNTSSQFEPTHTYLDDDNYTVTLTVTGAGGKTNTSTQTVSIQPPLNPLKVFLTKVILTKVGTSQCFPPPDGKPDVSYRVMRENGSFDVPAGIEGNVAVNAQVPVAWNCQSCQLDANQTYYLEFRQHDSGGIETMFDDDYPGLPLLVLPNYNINDTIVNMSAFKNGQLDWGVEIKLLWQ